MPETGAVWSEQPAVRAHQRQEFQHLIESADRFDTLYEKNEAGRTSRTEQDGQVTEIRAYEFTLNTQLPDEIRVVLLEFGLWAAKEGFTQAIGPLIVPDTRPPAQHGYAHPENAPHPIRVYTFLERRQPSPANLSLSPPVV